MQYPDGATKQSDPYVIDRDVGHAIVLCIYANFENIKMSQFLPDTLASLHQSSYLNCRRVRHPYSSRQTSKCWDQMRRRPSCCVLPPGGLVCKLPRCVPQWQKLVNQVILVNNSQLYRECTYRRRVVTYYLPLPVSLLFLLSASRPPLEPIFAALFISVVVPIKTCLHPCVLLTFVQRQIFISNGILA